MTLQICKACYKPIVDWNHLKTIEAVAATGSLSQAAKTLGVEVSTLSRQLQKLEGEFGVRVFKREGNRYLVTPAGRKWVDSATTMRRALDDLQPETAPEKRSVLVTSLENFINHFLVPRISRFHGRLEFVGADRSFDLSRREADVAIRFGRPTTKDYLVQKLFSAGHAIYVGKVFREKLPRSFEAADWVTLNDEFESIEDAKWFRAHVAPERAVYKVASSEQVLRLITHAPVLGILPCYMGDYDAALERYQPKLIFDRTGWLVTHREASGQRHIKTFCDDLRRIIKQDEALLAGK